MTLAIHADDRGNFRIHRGAEHAGWIEGRAVALFGFAGAGEARRAAGVAYDALRVWVARQRRTEVPPARTRALRTEIAGGRRMLLLDDVPVGRIVTPAESPSPRGGYGFELLLPQGFGPVSGIGAAQAIDAALARHAATRRPDLVAAGA